MTKKKDQENKTETGWKGKEDNAAEEGGRRREGEEVKGCCVRGIKKKETATTREKDLLVIVVFFFYLVPARFPLLSHLPLSHPPSSCCICFLLPFPLLFRSCSSSSFFTHNPDLSPLLLLLLSFLFFLFCALPPSL